MKDVRGTTPLEMIRLMMNDFDVAVFPVTARGKAPAIAGGFKAASRDKKTVADWFRAGPELNYGIATGSRSGIFVLDVDGPKGAASLKELTPPLPKTVTVKTPNGGLVRQNRDRWHPAFFWRDKTEFRTRISP
jgi:Bifunctional DNA primase/polymerase, N-terminal